MYVCCERGEVYVCSTLSGYNNNVSKNKKSKRESCCCVVRSVNRSHWRLLRVPLYFYTGGFGWLSHQTIYMFSAMYVQKRSGTVSTERLFKSSTNNKRVSRGHQKLFISRGGYGNPFLINPSPWSAPKYCRISQGRRTCYTVHYQPLGAKCQDSSPAPMSPRCPRIVFY